MTKISNISEKSCKNYEKTFNFKDLNAGKYVPCHAFLFDLLQKKTINSEEFTIFLVLLNKGFFEEQGGALFKCSYSELSGLTGLERRVLSRSLKTLSEIKLIKIIDARNGNPTFIELRIEKFEKFSEKNQSQIGTGTDPKMGSVENDQSQIGTGTDPKMGYHLYNKVLKVSSSHQNKFFDSKKRNIFQKDLMRLASEGFNMDAVASFLEIRVSDFERIKSFYGVIKSQKDSLQEIHEENEKNKNEMVEAERLRILKLSESTMDDIHLVTPRAISEQRGNKNAFKVKSEGFEVMQGLKFPEFKNIFNEDR